MKYLDQKAAHQKEINDFPMSFAFNQKQFIEGLERLNAKEEDVCGIPGGGFIRKTDKDAFFNMFLRHETERAESLKNDAFLIDALVYELANHEYCITYDPGPAMSAVGIDDDEIDDRIKRCLSIAIKKYREEVHVNV
jgi:hypothetical protein